MSKPTPGPWEFSNRNWRGEVDEQGYLYVTGDRHATVEEDDETGELVDGDTCTSVCRVEGNATSITVTTANARLIAAAPDLLKACQEAINDNRFVNHIHPDVKEEIRAAIAKAEGRS